MGPGPQKVKEFIQRYANLLALGMMLLLAAVAILFFTRY